jgi:hypothetical protein
MNENDKIGIIKQGGQVVGTILANQTVKWSGSLQGDSVGTETAIEEILAFQQDGLDSIAAVYAVSKLTEAFAGTSVSFALLVDQLYGTEPDVIN